jgi:hypothetical protein
MKNIQKAASALGKIGGASKSPAKSAASRANGAKGGRPRKDSFAPDGQFPRQASNKDINANPTGKTSVFSALTEIDVYDMFVIRRGAELVSSAGVPLAFADVSDAKSVAIHGDKIMRWSKVPRFLR